MKQLKFIHGVGINDADYPVTQNKVVDGKQVQIWICPFYARWRAMFKRAYSEAYQSLYTTYVGCSVCPEWIYFTNFKSWMETQDWEGKQLDKDLLVKSNKIYSPETCVFIEQKINKFMSEKPNKVRELPTGVSWDKKASAYRAQCISVETGKQTNLGWFDSPDTAHKAWLAFKLEQAHALAFTQSDKRIAKALIERYENYSKIDEIIVDHSPELTYYSLTKENQQKE
jgi:hypothetical protein